MRSFPVAIVGASCRFPQAPGLAAFDELLFAGRDAVGEVPAGRWSRALFYHPAFGQPGKAYTMSAGCIGDVDRFDPAFFGISAREAAHIDPQQRLLLELAHEAMEDAGIPAGRMAGARAGVFIGGSSWDYSTISAADLQGTDAYSMQGVSLSSLSNRVSYQFDLRGPSVTVDTACSSSLVALHLACEALQRSEITAALVGGVNLLLAPHPFVGFARASMLSRRGRCQAFDAKADGYVRAEGGGMVVLKPLRAALAAGDPIRAVILATGMNSDGHTNGFSVPSTAAQEQLLREVHASAGIAPDDVSYFEAHGTGTPVGDPLEANAIGKAIGQYRRTKLPIGSVKSNIGHLEPASGMAGLLKVIASFARSAIPASLHCDTPNPAIPFAELNIEVVNAPRPMVAGKAGLVAGLNSFGFGGTNAHVVLAAAPAPALASPLASSLVRQGAVPVRRPGGVLPPLLLSARAPAALRSLAASWQEALATRPAAALAPMLRGAARLRDHHPDRLALVGAPAADMAASLAAWLADAPGTASVSKVESEHAVTGKVAFVFSGNGSQWAGMAQDAIRHSAPFRKMLAEVDALLTPLLGWSVKARLARPGDGDDLRNTAIAQPLLFAVQVASVAALRRHGISADAHVGHSVGEVAAAWASGALDLGQAARVIVQRSLAQQSRHGDGRMAVLGLGADAAEAAIARIAPGLTVAAINSARSVTVAGSEAALCKLERYATTAGWTFILLDLDYAFHSASMDAIRNDVIAGLADLHPSPPSALLVSTVTGQAVRGATLDGGYWWHNVRDPVRFADAVETLIAAGVHLFIEVGPQPVLQTYMRDAVARSALPGRILGTLGRTQAEGDPFAKIAARCYVAGCMPTGAAVFKGAATARGLPLYPWQRERFWHERTAGSHEIVAPRSDHPLLGFRQTDAPDAWFAHPSTATDPWLGDHIVDGTVVMAAAGMIEMALAAGRALHPDAISLELRDLEIVHTLPLDASAMREVTLRITPAGGGLTTAGFTIASHQRLSDDPPTSHATGQVARGTGMHPVFVVPPDLELDDAVEIGAPALYQAAAALRLTYGPAFRTVRRVLAASSTLAMVELDDAGTDRVAAGYLVDPAVVDGALQGLIGLAAQQAFGDERTAVLPWRFGRVRLLTTSGARPTQAWVHLRHRGVRSLLADIALLDRDGVVVMELLECWFAAVTFGAGPDPAERMVWTALVPSRSQPSGAVTDRLDQAMDAVAVAGDTPETVVLAESMLALAARDALAARLSPGTRALVDDVDGIAADLLGWLEADGLARREGRGWAITEAAELPAWPEIWRTLLFNAPAAAPETALAGALAGSLGAIVAQGWNAAPARPAPLVEQMLFASPTGAGGIDAVLAALNFWLDGWPGGRPLRVAEIGGPCPGFTRRVLDVLARRVPALRYVVLAGSEEALTALADTLAERPGVTGEVWDPLASAAEFDLVLGLYPFTSPRGRRTSPVQAVGLLVPGGHLLVVETTANRLWQVVFGADQEHGEAASEAPSAWQARLEAAGCVRTRSAILAGGQLWQAAVIGAWRGAQAAPPVRRMAPIGALFALNDDALATALGAMADVQRRHDFVDLADHASPAIRPIPGDVVLMLPTSAGPPSEIEAMAGMLTTLAHGLKLIAAGAASRTWLITREAGAGAPVSAAVLGLLRTLANEIPELECRLVRIDPALPPEAAARRMLGELAAPDAEREIIWTPTGRFVRRLRRGAPPPQAWEAGATRLAVGRPGLLASLHWERFTPRLPGPGEVAISVRAAGLNFRDLMWAQGLLPEEALMAGFSGVSLGLEAAGVVTAVGAGVDDLAPGDRVIAVAPAALATDVVTLRRGVIRMPDGMDDAAGATIPVAFMTAVYALGRIANVAPGERVLIHAGLGSLGLAAIQYALHRGAIVYASAGSPVRRDLLQLLGVAGTFDSRNARFADEVMAATGGEGVDVVLNSLSGELMESGLRVLRPFGRFVEVGKRDVYRNTPIGIRPMRHNISFSVVDVDELAAQRPVLVAAIFAEINELLATGQLRALPYRRYRFDEAVDAFRQLQQSGHLGKIVLTPAGRPPALARPEFAVRPDRTYVLSGALGGFGLEAALFLARHGARHVALLGRRGAGTPGAAEAMARLGALGVTARAFACDVSDAAALDRTLTQIRAEMLPIAGVMHAAMVLDDALTKDLDAARFAAVLRPKLGGAEALDALTRQDELELFVLFSSITTVLGNPGQANYVAANAAMEAIAERRQSEGLPGLAVAWGPIADAGYLTRNERVSEALERLLGGVHMPAEAALAALPALLATGVAVAGLADLQWSALARQLPGLSANLLAEMPADGRSAGSGTAMRVLLAALSPEEAAAAVLRVLVDEISLILKVDPGRVDPDQVISELGMDSLTTVELHTAIEQRLDIQIPLSILSSGATLRDMSHRIARVFGTPAQPDEVVSRIMQYETEDESLLMEARLMEVGQ